MPKDKQEPESSRTLFIRFEMGHRQSAYANVYKGIRYKNKKKRINAKKNLALGKEGIEINFRKSQRGCWHLLYNKSI